METTHYSYNGKSWRPSSTMSDYNSFFHSAFGVKTDENEYFDKLANFRRMQWIAFLTYFEHETMPSCLTDILRKCFSVNEKCKTVCSDDKQNLKTYISALKTSEIAITKEEIPVLAALENTKVVILSNGGLHPVTVIEPNLNIFGTYPKEVCREKPKEVVLYLQGNVFTRLEPVREEQRPKPIKNRAQKKTDPSKYRKGGSAGSKGVKYQISLIAMVMLNAMKSALSEWKLSTENDDAGKFDDIVLEWTEGAVLIQSKHKEDTKKRITLDELTSTNSNNDDFSLPKYFLSYMSIKEEFNIKKLIICTNADVHKNALQFLNQQTTNIESFESLLHYDKCSFYTLTDRVIPILKDKTIQYYDKNFKNKDVKKSDITEDNLIDFLNKFQLYFNYPPLMGLEKIIEKLLSSISCCSSPQGKVTPQEIFSKLTDWFQQKEGVYFTKTHVKSIIAEIWTDRYCQKLKKYDLSFEKNNLNFPNAKQIFHVTSSHGNLLQAIRVYYALQNEKILFVNPEDDIATQKLILEAFALPQYVFLVINQFKVMEESAAIEMCDKLRDILSEKKYKKIILMTRNNHIFSRCLRHEIGYEIVDGSLTFADLSEDFQQQLVKRKSIKFQGKFVCLEELLGGQTTKDYVKATGQEILENMITGEVKVGVQPTDMDENIAPFYINRTFKRSLENIHEKDICDVREKAVLISDNAGVGKTTVLSKLATDIKEKYPRLWVIKIALTEYTHILRDLIDSGKPMNIMDLLISKNETRLTNHLERYVFSVEEKVVLMFDGVDEISPDYTELVYNLLMQCLQATNVVKLFVTTRPHMVPELKEILKVDPFELQPFTEQNQVDFLTGYWTHKLDIARENKEKCENYARALMERMSLWTEEGRVFGSDKFTAIALQLRMVAEIFQETVILNGSANWEGCKEYLESASERPNLPGKIELKELYDLFIERKRHIYVQKGNPSGNSEANTALTTIYNESFAYHKILAIEDILREKDHRLFSCYQDSSKVINESVLKIGIVQKSNGRFYFIHRTFAEYFVAESLVSELQHQPANPNLNFQEFFIDNVLTSTYYEVIRAFLDGFLQSLVDSIPSNIFKVYQSQSTNLNLIDQDIWVFNVLLRESCVTILKLILKCIDFKIKKKNSDKDLRQQKNVELRNLLETIKREHMTANTLNVLKILLRDMAFEFWDRTGNIPLVVAAEAGHLKMVMFLIDRGARVNSADKYGFTALHVAVDWGHTDMVKYLVQHGAEINCRNQQGCTPLHFAAVRSNLECFKYLTKSGADIAVRDNRDRTVLHFGAVGRFKKSPMDVTVKKEQLAIIEFLVEHNEDINIRDKDGCTPLHCAAKYSHLNTVKLLTELGADLTIRNNRGKTPLHVVSEFGHLDSVAYLTKFNKDVDIKDSDGCTPLLLAAAKGHTGVVKFLHELGADLNVMNNHGRMALHLTAEFGHLDGVKYLVMFNEDVNIKDNDGCTPLLLAALRGHTDVVKFLQEQNANVDVRDSRGKTVLHVFAENGPINEYFIKCVADINARDNNGCTALHLAAENGQWRMIEALHKFGAHLNRDGSGGTALHSAAFYGQLTVVKSLIKAGADLNNTNNLGWTELHSAAFCGRLSVVEYLLEKGADLKIRDHSGRTALYSASVFGHWNVAEVLLGAGADLKITNDCGWTKLHSAAFCGRLDVVKRLLEKGADLNISDSSSRMAFYSAAVFGHFDVVEFLLEVGADLNITNDYGSTALHSAAVCGRLDIVKYLFEKGADLNISDSNSRIALYSAAVFGHLDVVKYLVEAESDLNFTDDCGRTPLHSAAAYGHLDVVKYLLEAGADSTIKDKDNRTPMQLASFKHQFEIVDYFQNANKKSDMLYDYN